MNELERLKADLEVLERYQGYSIMENARADLADKIARLEADEADPWREAKGLVEMARKFNAGLRTTWEQSRRLAEYIDHLTAENARLEKENKALGKHIERTGREIANLEQENADFLAEIRDRAKERDEALARVAELEAEAKAEDDEDLSDPYKCTLGDFAVLKTAQEIIRYAMDRNPDHFDDTRICRRAIAAIADFAEKVRHWHGLKKQLPYRWGSLGSDTLHLLDHSFDVAESPTDYDPDLIKPVADMIPPFEGPIESIEPILDPARVLATAAKWIDKAFRDRSSMSRSQDAIDFLLRNGGYLSQPYSMKGGEE